jgi:hypothetical protein
VGTSSLDSGDGLVLLDQSGRSMRSSTGPTGAVQYTVVPKIIELPKRGLSGIPSVFSQTPPHGGIPDRSVKLYLATGGVKVETGGSDDRPPSS